VAVAAPGQALAAQASPPAAATSKPAPLDPASIALAHQILTIAFPPAKRSQMYASMMSSIVEQNRQAIELTYPSEDKEFRALLDRSAKHMFDMMQATLDESIPDYFNNFERAYARDFSIVDLKAILAFVQTPAGQHYFERAPLLLSDPDVQGASQRLMQKLVTQLPEIRRQSMKDVEDYVAKKKPPEKPANPT
jgi:hypothetical protein